MIPACILLVAALALGPSPPVAPAPIAPEQQPAPSIDARAEAARGEALFVAGKFDEASAAYERAYAAEPVPAFLFARARSEQEAGRCEAAIELYRSFIATEPPAADVDRANLEIGRCYGKTRAAEPAPPPRVEPAAAAPTRAPDAAPKPAPRATWIRDPAGGALLGTGLAVLATGFGLFFAGDAAYDRSQQAMTTDDFRRHVDRASPMREIGIGALTLGSGLLVAAIVRYAVVARRARRDR